MARIDGPEIIGIEPIGSDVLLFTIRYIAAFDFAEQGSDFDDAVKLWEDDPVDDDEIMPYPFPSRFNASGPTVLRIHKVTATRSMLNTELGNEEIKAQVWLRKVGQGPASAETFTIPPHKTVDA
jgi:hypothetical protein